MIIEFKMFESNEKEPKVGWYVLCKSPYYNKLSNSYKKSEFELFLETNIGVIVERKEPTKMYLVHFDNLPKILWATKSNIYLLAGDEKYDEEEKIPYCKWFISEWIEKYSENKEDLIIYRDANKYNL